MPHFYVADNGETAGAPHWLKRSQEKLANSEGVLVVLLALESGVSERLRVLEEHPKGLGKLVVLLNEGLVCNEFSFRKVNLSKMTASSR